MKKLNTSAKIAIGLAVAVSSFQACSKSSAVNNGGGNGGGGGGNDTSTTIIPPTEPTIAASQGFFLDNWQPKTWSAPTNDQATKPSSSGAVAVTVDLSQQITKISANEYGNNANPFMGEISTSPTLIKNISDLAPGIIRFPGGSLSDVYFWNQSSQGPTDAPSQLEDLSGNTSAAGYWFGNNTANWTMTVDDYYSALTQTNSTGIITVNYGYARYGLSPHPDQVAAHLAADWVRYDKGRTKYWEVGNENFGNWEAGYRINVSTNKDGQPEIQDGTTYGTHFKVFADSMRAAATEVGNTSIKIGIVLSDADDSNNSTGPNNWNSKVLGAAGNSADFFVVHNYYTPYNQNSSPSIILATAGTGTSTMMSWVKTSATNAGVTLKPVAMDEWNIFAIGSNQMVSNVAGVHAAMVLGEALKNQISMTSRWDLSNSWDSGNDQGMFSNSSSASGAEPNAPDWNARPAFYYMYYFQNYIGDHLVSTSSNNADVVGYGSSWSSGQAGVILANKGSSDHVVSVTFKNYAAGTKYYYYTLNGGTDNAPFSHKVYVNGTGPAGDSGGPATFKTIHAKSAAVQGGILVTVPANGVVYLMADKK